MAELSITLNLDVSLFRKQVQELIQALSVLDQSLAKIGNANACQDSCSDVMAKELIAELRDRGARI